MKTILNILKSGSILTNIFLSGYLIFLNEIVYDYFFYDRVLHVSTRVLHEGIKNYIFGMVLLIVIIIEIIAYYWKTRYGSEVVNGAYIFILWIFHTVIGVIMTIFALEALGIGFNGDMPVVTTLALFATVIKELFILGFIVTAPSLKSHSRVKSILSDLFLGIFYSFAFTIVIGNILTSPNYNNYLLAFWYSKIALAMNLFAVILLFFMFYLPLRLPYFMYSENKTLPERLVSIFSIILVCLITILPLFEGEYSLVRALEKPGEVKMLFLNNQGIDKVSPDIGKLTDLRVLHLGYNELNSLPEEMKYLEKLSWLNIGGNKFTEVPPEVLQLKSIKELDIHYNRIKFFPDDLSPFLKIKKIVIRSNMISGAEKKRIIETLGKERVVFGDSN